LSADTLKSELQQKFLPRQQKIRYPQTMSDTPHPVERLFPFVQRTGILVVGRERLHGNKGKLHFVLITEDIAPEHREEVLKDFRHYPVVQFFLPADLERNFGIKGCRAIGFMKSGLAQSIYAELKPHRINQPVTPSKPPAGDGKS
jgi:hypothetical protein